VSGGIFLYGGAVGPMTLKAWRRFDNAYPYTLEIDGCEWALTPDELGKLSRAAASIIRDLAPRRDGSRPKEGPRFHAEPRDGDKAVIIELGIEADGKRMVLFPLRRHRGELSARRRPRPSAAIRDTRRRPRRHASRVDRVAA
jgi:hypothetical protein